ncbi:acyl-CoA N-acyltransferase [Macroventuria anomochaeta]|uniref:Acyl-CoA N-acyltransferase n=1 Tax=Macroventuria anomochaeta TaxID=301207 RepID=A0ACB6S7I4_9PLEO|nr:acyl-CoA N-acyltransferase [Macroventuria anomochaeta]KAF2630101.1 acyl-CoA N-acyltransferase [Macroventuria anomochaeta]
MAAQPTPAHPAAMEAQVAAQANSAVSTATTSDPPIPKPIFTTSRLIVRQLHPQDAPSMSHHANNPKITEFMSLGFPSPYTLEAANGWINMNLTPPIYNWGISLRTSPSTIIGGCGLKPGVDVQTHAAEVGYWIGEEFWGRGLVTEMLAGLTRWVFEAEESLLAGKEGGKRWTRLWGGVFEGNKGSIRCFEKCGYKQEGVLRGAVEKNGGASDLVVFGLVKGEWEEKEKA